MSQLFYPDPIHNNLNPKLNKNFYKSSFTKYSILFCLFLIFNISRAHSQITLYTVQGFNFGTFYQGNSGGDVNISTLGSRSSTGDMVLINTGFPPSQAVFEIEAPIGSNVSILSAPDVTVAGSNGGSITLKIRIPAPFISTVAPPGRTPINIGGTLVIGNQASSPPGSYSGSFSITFHYE